MVIGEVAGLKSGWLVYLEEIVIVVVDTLLRSYR